MGQRVTCMGALHSHKYPQDATTLDFVPSQRNKRRNVDRLSSSVARSLERLPMFSFIALRTPRPRPPCLYIGPKFASLVESLKNHPGLCLIQPFATWPPPMLQWHGAKLTNNSTTIF